MVVVASVLLMLLLLIIVSRFTYHIANRSHWIFTSDDDTETEVYDADNHTKTNSPVKPYNSLRLGIFCLFVCVFFLNN